MVNLMATWRVGWEGGMQISYVAFYKANSDIPFIAATGKDAVKALAGHATHAKPVSQDVKVAITPGQQ
jgi:hypothetical protein